MEPNKDQSADAPNQAGTPGQGAPGSSFPSVPDVRTPFGTPDASARPPIDQSPAGKPYTVTPPATTSMGAGSTVGADTLPEPEAFSMPAQGAVVTGLPGVPLTSPSRRRKKKIILTGVVALVVLLLAGGAVFGLYLPNTPDSVWQTGMDRSGKALDSLVQSATKPDKLKAYDAATIKGTVNAEMDGLSYSGTLNTSFDKAATDSGVDVTFKQDGASQTVGAKLLTQIPNGSIYPDVYFQLNGLGEIGLDDLIPGVSDYDGQWIKIDSSYIKSIGDSYLSTTDKSSQQFTPEDSAGLMRAVSGVTKDYLLTNDADKAVLAKQDYIGKEHVDGITAYHYKVGINKDHLKAYCTALINGIAATDGYKKLVQGSSSDLNDNKNRALDDCKTIGDDITSKDTFDLWIDGHYKLIYKVRFEDDTDKGTYLEAGQLYKGGDQLSLFMNYHGASDKADAKITVNTNLTTNSTQAKLNYKQAGDSPYSIDASLNVAANDKPVQITPPANAIPFQAVLDNYGLGGLMSSGGIFDSESI